MKKHIVKQSEGLCHMIYLCKKCGKVERIWNSRPRVTPFVICCSNCDGEMTHTNFSEDKFDPNYQPQKGERVFIDLPKELAKIKYKQNIEAQWDHKEHPMSEIFKTKEQALKSLMDQWQFGMPMIETI